MGTIKGIDISSHQGKVDFNKVKKDGVKYIIPRSSFADVADNRFLEYVKGAKRAGIEVKGVYVFSYALSSKDAKAEADYCIKLVQKAGLDKNTIIFYDFEYDTVRYGRDNHVTLGPDKCQAFTKAFCQRVEELGYRAGIYANIDYYNRMYQGKVIGDYIFWLAHWTTGEPWKKCVVQQYTSKGRVSGISTNVDMDKWYGGIKEKDNTSKPEKEKKTDKKTSKKTNKQIAEEVLQGKWGNGDTRKKRLEKAGYDYNAVQKEVNKIIKSKQKKVGSNMSILKKKKNVDTVEEGRNMIKDGVMLGNTEVSVQGVPDDMTGVIDDVPHVMGEFEDNFEEGRGEVDGD